MKPNKINRSLESFEALNSFMETNLDKWNGIEEIRNTYDDFIINLKRIQDLKPELEKDTTGIRSDLESSRDQLITKIFPVISILEVYIQDHSPGKKATSLLLGDKKLGKLDHSQLLRYALELHSLCDKLTAKDGGEESPGETEPVSIDKDIRRYGLNEQILDELLSTTRRLQTALKLYEDVSRYRRKTRKKLEKLLRENQKLLVKRLNKLMAVFSGTHPSFYREYMRISKSKH